MNYGDEQTTLIGIRCAGVNTPNGMRAGGTYYPAVRNPDGTIKTSARWVGQFYINRQGRTLEDGSRVEGRRDIISLTFWNSRRSADGKGWADVAAKYISEGKELFCRAKVHSYPWPVKNIDGSVVMRSDGQGELMQDRHGWTLEAGSLLLSDDSQKIIDREIAAYTGEGNFHSRPPQWKVPGTEGNAAWKLIAAWRKAQTYQGGNSYGYAMVRQPGATVAPALTTAGVKAAADVTFPAGSSAAPTFPAVTVEAGAGVQAAGAEADPF